MLGSHWLYYTEKHGSQAKFWIFNLLICITKWLPILPFQIIPLKWYLATFLKLLSYIFSLLNVIRTKWYHTCFVPLDEYDNLPGWQSICGTWLRVHRRMGKHDSDRGRLGWLAGWRCDNLSTRPLTRSILTILFKHTLVFAHHRNAVRYCLISSESQR